MTNQDTPRHALWHALESGETPIEREHVLDRADATCDADRDRLGEILDTLEQQGEVYRIDAGYKLTDPR